MRTAGVLVCVALAGVAASVAASAAAPKPNPAMGLTAHQLHLAHSARAGSPSVEGAAGTGGNAICGRRVGARGHISHVIWIVMENRSYSDVITAPYISTLAADCAVQTNYHNISHPSLPNYIAMTSGRPLSQLPATDCPGFCQVSGPSIFSQTSSWGVFAESMPVNCDHKDARPYVAHHTAAPYYSAVTNCSTKDVPLTAMNLNALPAFSLIVPNVYNDMHEKTSSVAAGDAWLRLHLGAILASPVYQSGSTVVFVTWDEGSFPRTTNNCAFSTTDNGCHVALLAMSPYMTAGTRLRTLSNHYALLDNTEALLGLPLLAPLPATG